MLRGDEDLRLLLQQRSQRLSYGSFSWDRGRLARKTAWGEVLFASVLTNDSARTLAIGLRNYSTQGDVYWNQLMAAAIVVSIPVVIGFQSLQRYLIQGITAGGVKG